MASKKYKLLLGLITLMASTAFAQVGGTYSVYDSSVIPAKRMPQQNEFWNSTYNFPAKPRNMIEIGASIGMLSISGDVAAKIPTGGFEVHVRKALGYLFSLRLQYLYGTGKGMNWLSSTNFAKNPAWTTNLPLTARYGAPIRGANGQIFSTIGNGVSGGTFDYVFYNYKTKLQDLSLQGLFTFNNIRFHKQKTGFNIYAGGGVGATIFHTMINAYNESTGKNYADLFRRVATEANAAQHSHRKDILKELKDGMDNTYETEADNEGLRRPKIGDNTLKPSFTLIAGAQFKLGKRINLQLEDRHTTVKTDLLDGQRWAEQAYGDAVLTSDFDSYNFVSLGLNFNLGAKSVEPLWWLNPLDYAYDELTNHRRIKFPKSECPDTDGDGVCDHLDREPNTPAGCPVDTHGVSRDTDGDGVPDCKDKQLITPTECQPVDADGVGKCPDPACCTKKDSMVKTNPCPTDYPSITFRSKAVLSADGKAMLATVASKLKSSPTCNISITGYPETSKASQAECKSRVDAVKKYLVEKEGISADRITTDCVVGGGDKNTVDIKSN